MRNYVYKDGPSLKVWLDQTEARPIDRSGHNDRLTQWPIDPTLLNDCLQAFHPPLSAFILHPYALQRFIASLSPPTLEDFILHRVSSPFYPSIYSRSLFRTTSANNSNNVIEIRGSVISFVIYPKALHYFVVFNNLWPYKYHYVILIIMIMSYLWVGRNFKK